LTAEPAGSSDSTTACGPYVMLPPISGSPRSRTWAPHAVVVMSLSWPPPPLVEPPLVQPVSTNSAPAATAIAGRKIFIFTPFVPCRQGTCSAQLCVEVDDLALSWA